jgi:hypothetical protein
MSDMTDDTRQPYEDPVGQRAEARPQPADGQAERVDQVWVAAP